MIHFPSFSSKQCGEKLPNLCYMLEKVVHWTAIQSLPTLVAIDIFAEIISAAAGTAWTDLFPALAAVQECLILFDADRISAA